MTSGRWGDGMGSGVPCHVDVPFLLLHGSVFFCLCE
jgi:hypothetical protein